MELYSIGTTLIGLLAGLLSGLFGIGGGIVMVPMLIAFLGMPMLNANATSLAAMLLPVGALGVWTYYKAGYINLKYSLWIALGLFIGSFFGAELAMVVDARLLSRLYAVFLFYVACEYVELWKVFFKKNKKENEKEQHGERESRPFWLFVILGIGAGVIAGLFGKGGGIVIVPILVKLFKYHPKAASATSLAALQLPVGLPSVMVYAEGGYLNYLFAILMALGIVVGAYFGSKMAIRLPSKYFKQIYAIFLFGVSIYMCFMK
ncbi:MAG: sulfite exporter TauE/SafE family protein [Paludibacteraceae bacterium]|nr:sulfite exporter TauE/SafE family protein [Paludibacteraceae bacterium]